MHSREIVFEPLDAQQQRDSGNDPVILRAKKELSEPESGWYAWDFGLARVVILMLGLAGCYTLI
jgi:hypothetical protein